jgi:membrane associated rhomboid family serine protease
MNYSGRGNFLSSIPQVTRFLLVANIVMFIIDQLTGKIVSAYLGLYSLNTHWNAVQTFKSFQLVTHMFMHGSVGHIFFNMFGLYMFGRILESVIGSKKFFILYFLSGFGAAGLQLLAYYYQHAEGVMVGASGAIMGVTAAFAVLFPNVELMLIFLPVPIKAKYFVPIFLVIELFFGVANFRIDNIAHFAHVGGAIVGFVLVMFWKKNQYRMY